ncbi:MAG: helix-turn-helix transcriptional regulator [Acidobacteriaceae bacterium]|nr:helix-turn-helix transcriptional regulator [Acidobacteriaceae bacterium]
MRSKSICVKPRSLPFKTSAAVFSALGDETRLRLVARLSAGEPLSITQLAFGTNLTRQAVTKHLHVLAHARLVHHRKQGREQLWTFDPQKIQDARRMLDRIGQEWESALSRLKAIVESDDGG